MRRFTSCVLAVLVLSACDTSTDTPTGLTEPQFAGASGKQQATGAATFDQPSTRGSFSLAAHSDVGGANPHGNAWFKAEQDPPFDDFDVRGPVTCLAVVNNRAAIGIRIAKGTFAGGDVSGLGFIIIVEDNGPPGHGVPDGVSNTGFFPDPENLPCAAFVAQGTVPTTGGNIVVK